MSKSKSVSDEMVAVTMVPYDEDIPQSQLRLPVSLQSVEANATRRLFDVGMPDLRPEERLRWALGVVDWNLEVQLPHAICVRRSLRSRDKDRKLGQVFGHRRIAVRMQVIWR